jgi:Flp pilus assembly protein TadD
MGNFDLAIADLSSAANLNSKDALALYARGVAELRKSETEQGDADIKAATGIQPKIADYFNRHGIAP